MVVGSVNLSAAAAENPRGRAATCAHTQERSAQIVGKIPSVKEK
jgi:hypothetical protein